MFGLSKYNCQALERGPFVLKAFFNFAIKGEFYTAMLKANFPSLLKSTREIDEIHLRVASLLRLDDLEDEGVLGEDPEHVDDAGHHPGLHRGQALRLGGVGCDRVENVDQDEEQSHQESHAS